MVGSFELRDNGTGFTMSATAKIDLKIGSTSIFKFDALGYLRIDSTGVVAVINLSLQQGFSIPSALGIGFSVGFVMELNTTGSEETFQDPAPNSSKTYTVANGFFLQMSGYIEVLILKINGSFTLSVDSDHFLLEISANVNILGASLGVSGFAGIYYGSNPGFVLDVQLTLGSNNTVVVNPASGITISGSFQLSINTTGVTRTAPSGTAVNAGVRVVVDAKVNLFGFVLKVVLKW